MRDATEVFEEQRPHLRAVALRMLGSHADADDAVQEAWLRLHRTDVADVENLPGWLTTVVARISLNALRSRATRREEELGPRELVVEPAGELHPEDEALVADSVGLALLVVLETLTPAERLAFVLHDVFAVPFEEIAPLVERTPAAARQLASRARRKVRGAAPAPDAGLPAQREVVEAFFAAGRSGRLDRLVAVLAPDVRLRVDAGPERGLTLVEGAEAVAGRALMFAGPERRVVPATVDGRAGAVIVVGARPVSVMAFTVHGGRVAAIDATTDAVRLAAVDLARLG